MQMAQMDALPVAVAELRRTTTIKGPGVSKGVSALYLGGGGGCTGLYKGTGLYRGAGLYKGNGVYREGSVVQAYKIVQACTIWGTTNCIDT